MRPMNQMAHDAINRILDAFDAPSRLVDTVAKAALIPNTSPCCRWSMCNRFLVALAGTSDARGFRQWQEVGRRVTKGAKPFHILVPALKKVRDEETDEERQALVGFRSAPVFRVENTEGEPLPETIPKRLPKLQSIAMALGIPVNYAGAVSDSVAGVYTHDRGDLGGHSGKITLYTHGLATFYHELSHALHHRAGLLCEGKSDSNKRDNETVAEISAAVLVRLFEEQEIGQQAIQYVTGHGAKKTHLLTLLPEIMSIVDLAIRIANPGEQMKGVQCEASNS